MNESRPVIDRFAALRLFLGFLAGFAITIFAMLREKLPGGLIPYIDMPSFLMVALSTLGFLMMSGVSFLELYATFKSSFFPSRDMAPERLEGYILILRQTRNLVLLLSIMFSVVGMVAMLFFLGGDPKDMGQGLATCILTIHYASLWAAAIQALMARLEIKKLLVEAPREEEKHSAPRSFMGVYLGFLLAAACLIFATRLQLLPIKALLNFDYGLLVAVIALPASLLCAVIPFRTVAGSLLGVLLPGRAMTVTQIKEAMIAYRTSAIIIACSTLFLAMTSLIVSLFFLGGDPKDFAMGMDEMFINLMLGGVLVILTWCVGYFAMERRLILTGRES